MANLVLASSLIGLPLGAVRENAKIGSIKTILIDTRSGYIAGFLVKEKILDWFSPPKFVALGDIVSFDKTAAVVNKKDDVLRLDEAVRAKEIYQRGFGLFGSRVVTESGKYIGRVTELSLSLDLGIIVNFYVRSWLGERIIHRTQIVEIKKNKIVVKDELKPIRPLAQIETA